MANVTINGSEAGDDLQAEFNNIPVGDIVVRINGNGGNDTGNFNSVAPVPLDIYGGAGDDTLSGGGSHDTMYGGTGIDRLDGGNGNDILYSDGGGGVLSGGNDNDTLYGGEGVDRIGGGAGIDVLYGDIGADGLEGGAGNDTLYGGADADRLEGQAGNDMLFGDDGADVLFDEQGMDTLYGGAGNDTLTTRDGNDTLFGGDGADTINGSENSTAYGDGGDDTFLFFAGNITLNGGEGNDRFNATVSNHIFGGAGDDFINVFFNSSAINSPTEIHGGDGNDTVFLSIGGTANSATVNFLTSSVTYFNGNANEFTFFGIEEFTTDPVTSSRLNFIGDSFGAPIVVDDNLQNTAQSSLSSRFFIDGDTNFFVNSLSATDTFDVLGFNAVTAGTVTVTSYRQEYQNVASTYTIDVEQGDNTLLITPPTDFNGTLLYALELEFSGILTAADAEIQTFLNGNLVNYGKLLTVDMTEFGAKLFELVFTNLDEFSKTGALLGGIAKKLGVVGQLIDLLGKADNIAAAFDISVERGKLQTYIEVMDFMGAAGATGAGGFAGTYIGGPFGGIIGGFSSSVVYSLGLNGYVRAAAENDYNDRFNAVSGSSANALPDLSNAMVSATTFDPSDLIFDEAFYIGAHPEAVTAVEAGDFPSYFAYFLSVGIPAGHIPNAGAPAIPASEVALNLAEYNPQTAHHTAILTADVGAMVGDDLSAGEQALAVELNSRRAVDVNIDAGLSAVANRVARDWVLNQTEDLEIAGFTGGVSDWVDELSNGADFTQTLAGLTGLTAGLDGSVRVLAVLTSEPTAAAIADLLVERAENSAVLLGNGARSYGVAEYAGLWVILVDQDVNANDAAVGTLIPTVSLLGTDDNDSIFGGQGMADVDLAGGNDKFMGGVLDDIARGGEGHDDLNGGLGSDRLIGDAGNDTLNGGDGADTLNGGDGDDFIFGGDTTADLRDVVFAGSGNDSIDGGYGNDLISGQDGNDTIAGGFGSDTLNGQNGNDVITGSALSDLVSGNAGDDFVNGGFGHDRINGGTGADRFFHLGIFNHGSDFIQDYNATEGDVLLSGIAGVTRNDFQVNFNDAVAPNGEAAGDDNVQEAFVIYRPTGQILWALIDGAGQSSINLRIGTDTFDLLA